MRKLYLISFILTALASSAQNSPLIVLEAESATLTPPVKVKRVNGYSGNAYVGDFDPGSVIRFDNVKVDKEGPYEFRVYYTSMFNRTVNVTAGNYPSVSLTIKRTTPEWDRPPVYMMLSYIWLDKGSNTIVITPPANDGGPNIDKFEIWETGVNMPKPEIENPAYSYDLTDEAVTATFDGLDVKNSELNDNDISTLFKVDGKTGYIKYEFDTPYLITGYFFSEGPRAASQGDDWELEYSTDNRTYVKLNSSQKSPSGNGTFFTINRQPHADRSAAAKYFRINTKGRDVAEIQLFGIPYINSADNRNFPTDLTEGANLQTMVSGYPLGQTGWADERFYNLFDRNMQTKYYTEESRTCYIEVELPTPMTLDSYTLTSCQDYPERDPKSWIVEGFDKSWEPISEIINFDFPCRYATMRFPGDDSKLYRGFRLRVTENNGASDRFQFLKLQLFGSDVPAAVENISAGSDPSVISGYGYITICSDTPVRYSIYSISGYLISGGEACGSDTVNLSEGFYVVALKTQNGYITRKIAVK